MRILITAGPTREAIDPVRFLSNRSSGKMGYALAEAAIANGHEVVLVSGPVKISPPDGLDRFIPVDSARHMFEAVRDHLVDCDAAIYCAAVSDYRPIQTADQKLKKCDNGDRLTLELEKTEDVLGSCREVFNFQGILMGFAAETENLAKNAREKLTRKGCDFVVGNDVSRKDIGFDSDHNEVIIFGKDGSENALPMAEKRVIGIELVRIIEEAAEVS